MNVGRLESRYQETQEAARQHDQDRRWPLALEVHALAHGLALAMVVLLDAGEDNAQRELWRMRATYHANTCENLRKLVASAEARDSSAVENAVWSIVRTARGLLSANQRVLDNLPGWIHGGLIRDFEALDAAMTEQRDKRGVI